MQGARAWHMPVRTSCCQVVWFVTHGVLLVCVCACRHSLSLYTNISSIRWDYDSELVTGCKFDMLTLAGTPPRHTSQTEACLQDAAHAVRRACCWLRAIACNDARVLCTPRIAQLRAVCHISEWLRDLALIPTSLRNKLGCALLCVCRQGWSAQHRACAMRAL